MADQYFDRDYAEALLGAEYVASALADGGRDFSTIAQAATALVRSALLNSGYSTPTSTDGTGVEQILKFASVGQFVEILCTAPGSAIPLPERWEDNPLKKAQEQITTGAIKPDDDPDSAGAVGGFAINISAAARRTTRGSMDLW